ncbi:Endonuclease/exonuclease/phosphatase [Agrocybe pediades]|nr:Endonuclease/exonuclease/phosphatase [Agrocybe pediades]
MIHEELSRQNADILCLQEVDRLEKLLPMLENAGYSHHYASGRGKQHGCLIAFKKTMYSLISSKVVFYDEENIGMDRTVNRLGGSFKTRNIGNLVALRSNTNENEGVVIGTTHLFWHPRYTYERTRQTAILVRELLAFREEKASNTWPCIIGGDFNFTPSDPAYSLLSGNDLLESQIDAIKPSLVVHASLDSRVLNNLPTVLSASAEEESEDADPDKVITNARPATAEDGLLTVSELSDWFSKLPSLHSAHDEGLKAARREGNVVPTYGDRISLPSGRKGTCEPSYTSYTHYWQSVLDYIFFIDGVNRPVTVTGLLAPLHESDLVPGLPKKGISGSDHTCLVAELSW